MSLVGMGFDSKCDFCPTYHLSGASPLLLDMGYLFLVGSNILLSVVVQQQVVILELVMDRESLACCSPWIANSWI